MARHGQGSPGCQLTELIRPTAAGKHFYRTNKPYRRCSVSEIEGRSTMHTDNIVRFRSLDKARPTNRLN